jgi:hypothetical protein
MADENLDLVKSQFLAGHLPSGSILAKALAELSPQEIALLKNKAAEGSLGLELQRMNMLNRFQASSVDIDDFIRNVQRMERTHSGVNSSYSMQGRFETASGETTITSKKGCYIATAVYGSSEHPNVLCLRQFRDQYLEANWMGRALCAIYYRVSPILANSIFSGGRLRRWMRLALDRFCRFISNP